MVINSEACIDWVETAVEQLTEQLCDANPALAWRGVLYALYGAYDDILIRGMPLRFEEVIQRGIRGGADDQEIADTCREYWFSPLDLQRMREAMRQYAALTSPSIAQSIHALAQHDAACQLQALELHRSLALPQAGDRWLQEMFPSGHRAESLTALEKQLHNAPLYTDIPF